jgi:formate dehydrogenase major subunit
MIPITIDGQSLEVQPGTTVLKAAQNAGICIPTLCSHPALKPYGACRLCVVEVEGARTLQASCTLPVFPNMIIRTNTPRTRKAREFVLTLIFSERNHFCMYCQKTGGDCELQNAAYSEGMTHWPIQPNWNPQIVDASSPYFVFDHNRCILCRRCVRSCAELVGNFTLSLENRGASSHISADVGIPIGESSCIRCGTCVQACPTGTLIDRKSAYLGKVIAGEHVKTICTSCSVGCGIDALVRNNKVIRIDGDWEAPINKGILCEKGRYKSIDDSRKRILHPMIRQNGLLQDTSWDVALAAVATHMKTSKNEPGIAAITSPRLSVESLNLFKQIFSQVPNSLVMAIGENGSSSLDKKITYGNLNNLKEADCVLMLGADPFANQQVAGFFIKRNRPNGNCIIVIDSDKNQFDPIAHYTLKPKLGKEKELLNGLIVGIHSLELNKVALPDSFTPLNLSKASTESGIPTELLVSVAREIACAQKLVIILGKQFTKKNSTQEQDAIYNLAKITNPTAIINLGDQANSRAVELLGYESQKNVNQFETIYIALGDDEMPFELVSNLPKPPFIMVQASYFSNITEQADIILPVETWFEGDGYFINMEDRLQRSNHITKPEPGIFSSEEVLRNIADMLGVIVVEDWKNKFTFLSEN